MSRWSGSLIVVGCVAGTLALAASHSPSGHHENDVEIVRLRAHFDSVLAELRSADVAALSMAQRSARATLIERLGTYAAAGTFPHNHMDVRNFVPVFRDDHGTLCAMAYLIASTGRTDIVDDVARENNLALILDLAADPRLVAWLDSTGLTVAEAARIQPTYGSDPCTVCRLDDDDHRRVRYFAVSLGVTAVSGILTAANLDQGPASSTQRRVTGWLGIAAGGAQMIYGAAVIRPGDPRWELGYANLAIGSLVAGVSAWRLLHPPREQPANVARVSVAPFIASPRQAGFVVSARM